MQDFKFSEMKQNDGRKAKFMATLFQDLVKRKLRVKFKVNSSNISKKLSRLWFLLLPSIEIK